VQDTANVAHFAGSGLALVLSHHEPFMLARTSAVYQLHAICASTAVESRLFPNAFP